MRLDTTVNDSGYAPFRSPACRDTFMAHYDALVALLPAEIERRTVPTRFGNASVLVTGPPDAPPVLSLHGLNFGGPLNLGLLLPLAKHFRLYAADTPGQPGRTTSARLFWRRHEYGHWVGDVLDGLGLDVVPAIGMSFGGAMLLDTAICQPKRFSKAVLLVPGGLARVALLRVVRDLAVPSLLYRVRPSDELLRRAVVPLIADPPPHLLTYFDLLFRNTMPVAQPPPTFTRAQLAQFETPTLVFAAEDDAFFPLARMRTAVEAKIRNLARLSVLPGLHIPGPLVQQRINAEMLAFLQAEA